jgi:hypothetical protein
MVCSRLVEAASGEELPSGGTARCQQLLPEELRSDLMGIQQPLPLADVFAARSGAAVFVAEGEVDPVGQFLHRLAERAVVHLLDEGNYVATLSATEAVVAAYLRADMERG